MGKDSWEQAKIDEITDTWHDVVMCLMRMFFSEREEDKAAQKARIPPLLAGLETRLKDNNGGQKFYVGDEVSVYIRNTNIPFGVQSIYRKLSSISRTKFKAINVSRRVLQLSLPNPLKPGVRSRMKMLEQRRQALHLSDQQLCCLQRRCAC